MTSLSSLSAVTRAIERARDISLIAYQLPRGPLLAALEDAAHRGCRVHVRLEGRPYPDPRQGILRHNETTIRELRRYGVDARLADADGATPLHAKAIRVDGALYLDDINFAKKGTLLRVKGSKSIAWSKRDALDAEKKLLEAPGCRDRIEVESESIGRGSVIYAALLRLACSGNRAQLLVSREALTSSERLLLERLESGGVDVRIANSNEKFAVAGTRAWIGSANATSSFPKNDVDWGLTTRKHSIVEHLRESFEQRWKRSSALDG